MERQFIVFGPDEALSDFAEVAEAAQMTANRKELVPLRGTITAAIEPLIVALKEGGPLVASTLAMAKVIVTFLKGRAERQVTITKNEKDRIISLDAKGYSPEQLTEILKECRDVIVFAPPKQKAQSNNPKAKAQ